MNINIDEMIKGVFLLILAISANFVGNILGCQTQKLLTENMLVKHMFLIFLIYFTINFTSSIQDNPLEELKKTLLIWSLYIIFTKMTLLFTGLTFLSLLTVYIMNNYIEFLKTSKKKDNKLIYRLKDQKKMLYKLIIILMVIGFSLYVIKQRNDYKNNFSWFKFLLGTPVCKSLR